MESYYPDQCELPRVLDRWAANPFLNLFCIQSRKWLMIIEFQLPCSDQQQQGAISAWGVK